MEETRAPSDAGPEIRSSGLRCFGRYLDRLCGGQFDSRVDSDIDHFVDSVDLFRVHRPIYEASDAED